jgi:thiamine-monophosphate kinase
MIDVSDGLSSEILHLSDQSKVGFRLYEGKIPIDPLTMTTADELNLNPVMCALNGGEDFELLFTIPAGDYDKIKNHPDFTIIGHVTTFEEGNYLVAAGSNELIALNAQGWDAFLKR